MRILRIVGFALLALQVTARCRCDDQAAREIDCDAGDFDCICSSSSLYQDRLERCIFTNQDDCTDSEIRRANSEFESNCNLPDEEEETTSARPSTTRRPLLTLTTESPTSSTDQDAETSSSATRRLSTPTTSSTSKPSKSAEPTNTSASNSSSSDSGLSKAVIGGIAGGAAGFVLLLIAIVVFCTFRKYKKKDQHTEKMREVDAEGFIEGGRQLRAKSMTLNANDRLYSTQRPLSYALGEYDSSNYRDHGDDHHPQTRGMDETPSGAAAAGGYFNRFSGNYVDDSSQAFSTTSYNKNTQPQGYAADSSYQQARRSVSIPSGGLVYPTASLSYEQYRNQARDSAGERTSLIEEESIVPQRSVSAPVPQRISRKPIGGTIPEDGSYYDTQFQYNSVSETPLMGNDSGRVSR